MRVLIGRELQEIVRTRAFAVTTVLGILMVVAAAVVPPLLPTGGMTTTKVAVIDPTATLTPTLSLLARGAGQGQHWRFTPWRGTASTLAQAVAAGRVDAGVVATPGPQGLADASFRLIVGRGDPNRAQAVSALVRAAVIPLRLRAFGLSQRDLATLSAPVPFHIQALGRRSPFTGSLAAVGLVYLFIILLFLMVAMYGQMVLMGVSAEKASRVSEVLMITVRPLELMLGKVLGVGLAGLVQLGSVAVVGLGLYQFDPAVRQSVGMLHGPIPLWSVVPLVLFFVLGYLFYGGLFAGIGASVRQPEEARSAAALPTMLMLVAYIGSILGLRNVESPYIVASSFVPPLTPWLMFERLVLSHVAWWQVVIAVVVTAAAIAVVFLWAAGVYRRNLVSSAPFSLWPMRAALRR